MKIRGINNYILIIELFTKYNTVAKLLRQSAETTSKVGQKCAISTYDLDVIDMVVASAVQITFCAYWNVPCRYALY